GGVNSTPANSSPANENPAEPLKEEPEKTHARTREAEDDDWRRRYDAEQEANRPVVPPPWGPTPDTPSPPSGRPRGDQGLTSAQLAERKAFLQRQAAELAQQAAERRSPEHPEGVRSAHGPGVLGGVRSLNLGQPRASVREKWEGTAPTVLVTTSCTLVGSELDRV